MLRFSAVLICCASAVLGQDMQEGAALYANHCAVCHGAEATGGGPMAPVLLVQPPDLTGLAARNDGVFPAARAIARIDGRDPLVSHGSPMPVYGPYFEGRGVAVRVETGQTMMTSQPVVDLVEWLTSLQD